MLNKICDVANDKPSGLVVSLHCVCQKHLYGKQVLNPPHNRSNIGCMGWDMGKGMAGVCQTQSASTTKFNALGTA